MIGRKVRSLKVRLGWECCISRGQSDGPSYTAEIYKLEEPEEKVTMLVGVIPSDEAVTQYGGQLQKCLEF